MAYFKKIYENQIIKDVISNFYIQPNGIFADFYNQDNIPKNGDYQILKNIFMFNGLIITKCKRLASKYEYLNNINNFDIETKWIYGIQIKLKILSYMHLQ